VTDGLGGLAGPGDVSGPSASAGLGGDQLGPTPVGLTPLVPGPAPVRSATVLVVAGAAAALAVVGLVVGVVVFLARGDATPSGRGPGPARLATPGPSGRVAGFDEVAFGVRRVPPGSAADEPARPGCALLADTPARQRQGLMGRRDLAGYDAMVFQFSGDTNVGFYNKDVPIALSIAWFDRAGTFITEAELPVCTRVCPTVSSSRAFRYAVEVPSGGLARLGIEPASVLHVGGTCP
jgi:uncharacterized membrane protein (UPF0127 family)